MKTYKTAVESVLSWKVFITASVLVFTLVTILTTIPLKAIAGEPTESQMRAAVEARYQAANEHLRAIKRQCQDRRAINSNPLLAMKCLSIYAGSGGTGNLSYHISYFKKTACDESLKVGYICYFVFSQSSTGAYHSQIDSMSSGLEGSGRFVKSRGRWVFIPLRSDDDF